MLAIHDHIRELRAELAECRLTRRERLQSSAELAGLLVRLAAKRDQDNGDAHAPSSG